MIGNQTAIEVSGRVPLSPEEHFDLRLKGDARLELLEPAFEDAGLAGSASADLQLRGTAQELELVGEAVLREAEGTFQGLHLSEVRADIEGSAGRVLLRSLTGKLLGGEFRLQGELPLSSAPSSGTNRLQFDVTELDVAELLSQNTDAASKPILKLSAFGTLETPTLSGTALRGSGTISRLEAGSSQLIISNPEPAAWSLAAGRLELPALRLVREGTDLRIGMTASLREGDRAWEASLRGNLDNALVNPLLGDFGLVIAGGTELDLIARSATEGFVLEGSGSLREARVVIREPPLVLSDLRGDLRFEGRRITLTGMSAEAGGGRVEGSGTFDLLGHVDLSLSADSVRLNYPEGLRSEQSGSFRLSGGRDSYLLSGDLRLLQSLYNGDLTLQ